MLLSACDRLVFIAVGLLLDNVGLLSFADVPLRASVVSSLLVDVLLLQHDVEKSHHVVLLERNDALFEVDDVCSKQAVVLLEQAVALLGAGVSSSRARGRWDAPRGVSAGELLVDAELLDDCTSFFSPTVHIPTVHMRRASRKLLTWTGEHREGRLGAG